MDMSDEEEDWDKCEDETVQAQVQAKPKKKGSKLFSMKKK